MAAASGAIVCGVEGGATNTTLVLYDLASGEALAQVAGPGTNYYVSGLESVVRTILSLVGKAKAAAGLPSGGGAPFVAMGLCLAGFAETVAREALEAALPKAAPGLSHHYLIVNDSVGSVYSASPTGGVVVISGTGSVAQNILPSGEGIRTGGWGHMIGDEGSAYYVALKAVKLAMRAADGYEPCLPDHAPTLALILRHFRLRERAELLEPFYGTSAETGFSKDRVASLTQHLAAAAVAGDAFCRLLFCKAGAHLGRMVRTVVERSPPEHRRGATADAPLNIVAVGSMWKSYEALFRDAFRGALCGPHAASRAASPVQSYRLLRLTQSSAVGVAYLAAKAVGRDMRVPYDSVTELLDAVDNGGSGLAAGACCSSIRAAKGRPACGGCKYCQSCGWGGMSTGMWAVHIVGAAAFVALGAAALSRRG